MRIVYKHIIDKYTISEIQMPHSLRDNPDFPKIVQTFDFANNKWLKEEQRKEEELKQQRQIS